MSIPERAPEPTMDEILASIRRIIADEEPQSSPDPRPFGASSPIASSRPFGSLLDKRKSGFAEPNSPASEQPKAGEDEDDILDLTKVLSESGYRRPAEEPAPSETVSPDPDPEPEPEPSRASEPLSAEELDRALAEVAMAIDQNAAAELEATTQDVAFEVDDVAAPPAVTPDAPASGMDAAATSVLRSRRSDVDPESLSWDEEPVAANDASMEAWPSELARRLGAGRMEPTVTPEPVKAVLDDTSHTPPAATTPPTSASAIPNGSAQEPYPSLTPPVSAGATATPASSAKSLEDSVKEMLRPMLREWLDANMMRIVEETMREELGKDEAIQRRH